MITHHHYQTISAAIEWLVEHQEEQPELDRLARFVGCSPAHLQRTFQAWAGVSPKQFLKHLTRKAALQRLAAGASVLDAAIDTGLSGPGRLHDLMVTTEALTPGEIRRRGAGVNLECGSGQTPFGAAVVSWNDRGISFLGFSEESGTDSVLEALREQWAGAAFRENDPQAQRWLDRIFDLNEQQPLPVWLRGSPFQLKVWEALLAVPEGTNVTYGRLASAIGQPGASRAVGTALGNNPVAWIIPCHRVIRQAGQIGNYRWGEITKRAMIASEAARTGARSLRTAC